VFPSSRGPGTAPAYATGLPVFQGDNDVAGPHILVPNPVAPVPSFGRTSGQRPLRDNETLSPASPPPTIRRSLVLAPSVAASEGHVEVLHPRCSLVLGYVRMRKDPTALDATDQALMKVGILTVQHPGITIEGEVEDT
jgi:hypothetical protein